MPPDRLLGQLLQTLESSDPTDTPRIYGTATHLLTTLTNPLNLTLLTHHLLTSSALWSSPSTTGDLTSTLRFISIFQSAASRLVRHEEEQKERAERRIPHSPPLPGQPPIGGGISRGEWLHSVLKGADERSPVVHHVYVFAGLLIGFCGHEREGLNARLRRTLEEALVRAVNSALSSTAEDEQAAAGIALSLNYSFELVSDLERARIDYDRLLPVLVGSAFFSNEGYQSGRYLEGINSDITQSPSTQGQPQLSWPPQSPSYTHFQALSKRPLITTMGPMSRLTAHTIQHLTRPPLIQTALSDLLNFSQSLSSTWQTCTFSAIPPSQESTKVSPRTQNDALPLLWRTFRTTLFAITIILRGITTRLLNDGALSNDDVAPGIACQILHILRRLYFILTHHATPSSFSQYTFVNLCAIDILSAYPEATTSFLTSIHPPSTPTHPLDLTATLFYLNTAEHLTLVLPPHITESLLQTATPYLTPSPFPPDLQTPIFESAHSLFLSILSSPQNTTLASVQIPFYVAQLMRLFPDQISARQFRLAVKTVVSVAAEPGGLGWTRPELAGTVLEVVRHRALSPQLWGDRGAPYTVPSAVRKGKGEVGPASTLVLSFIDSLPALSPQSLLEWLSLVAELLSGDVSYENRAEREMCRQRFWECISGEEMDVERAGVCVMWWGTMGGRERVLGLGGRENVFGERGFQGEGGGGNGEAMMSGALLPPGGESKL